MVSLNNKDINKLFYNGCSFVMGITNVNQIPDNMNYLPEVAFVGRSNVGKSSLINSLVNRKSIARVSKRPGSTSQINFFNLNNLLMLVDLPGYGYAKLSKSKIRECNSLIKNYLTTRSNLRRVIFLLNAGHTIKEHDIKLMHLLDDSATNYQILLTKIDLVSKKELEERTKEIQNLLLDHPALLHKVLFCSSKNNLYMEELRLEILSLIDNRG